MQLNDGERDSFCSHVVDTNESVKMWKGNLLDISIDCLMLLQVAHRLLRQLI
jgi:hypothetical protein